MMDNALKCDVVSEIGSQIMIIIDKEKTIKGKRQISDAFQNHS